MKGAPVQVRINVYNQGDQPAAPFKVLWYPGENYPEPACMWTLSRINARGGRILRCTYAGYPSWYSQITTKVEIEIAPGTNEGNADNNIFTKRIRVTKPH